MNALRTIAREIWGLFVDDGQFAVAILGWLLVLWSLGRWAAAGPHWRGPLLAAGLIVILAESALRAAGRPPRPPNA